MGATLSMLTLTVEVEWLPAASRATAYRVCEPYIVMPVESHVVVYVLGDEVEVISEPMLVVPSSLN